MKQLPETADVVIIGAGLMGCCTAFELAKRSVKNIVVLEKNAIGSGATGQSSGVLRGHYSYEVLTRMAVQSLDTFKYAEEILGADVGYQPVGYLFGVDHQNIENLQKNVEMQKRNGVYTDMVSREEVKEISPYLDTDLFGAFSFEPEGGYGDPVLLSQAYAEAARQLGVTFKQHCAVDRVMTSQDGSSIVGVETVDHHFISTPSVIVAAGVGAHHLMKNAGVEVPIKGQRAQLIYIDPGAEIKKAPSFGDFVQDQYIKPEVSSGHLLLGNADHASPHFINPSDYDKGRYPKHATEKAIETAITKFSNAFPTLDNAKLLASYSAAYEITPDGIPYISRTPVEGVYLCTGFSGHGYKITPVVGKLTADLVLEGESTQEGISLSPFRLSRLNENDSLKAAHPYTTTINAHV
ncbi:Glycine/D-amino acid oxidase [Halobacillus karajensis]|uniref:Sarcosine oxidase subunit beta n=1 Tax=Halobacillus karajensis TaxID=195088 RepID=A0A024P1R7_9BACI|nr:FAD-dependent oxidoreductase [Halobacillus karajensis]CDQ19640.1 Sarcosine oxidase subunit beta [Halobacillus karajensis]CDQ22100.1 Sarcosine oxidase subunit beta [Halobacillus karajensis]CDQ27941.1 Sarcosine oxidase subunit beta [Halobacillus karajensis]SEH79047.1 Glycine/D-amino acid oxidase [Halobacillus karajensis]